MTSGWSGAASALNDLGIVDTDLVVDKGAQTTIKTRLLARHPAQPASRSFVWIALAQPQAPRRKAPSPRESSRCPTVSMLCCSRTTSPGSLALP